MIEHLIHMHGTCCICTKPLKNSKYLFLAHLDKKASWKFPVWNNFLIPGLEDRAIAVVCDDCADAFSKSGVSGMIKYAFEFCGDKIIMHDIDELEDADPIQNMIDFYNSQRDDRKMRDDMSFECCPGSKKDQKHGFFGGLN